MPLDLFTKIVERAKEQSWTCTILGNRNGIPKAYQALCDGMKARIVLPAEYDGAPFAAHTTIVFESSQVGMATNHPSVSRAILRLQRGHLHDLSEIVLTLSHHFTDISIRHSELLLYTDQDLTTYKNELNKIGQWLLSNKESWTDYRIDCLTDRFGLRVVGECGAGVKSIAVGPTGELYLCPALFRDGEPSHGHILRDIELSNRHLLSRECSVPCSKCDALHCLRCVYLNKRSTYEFCVPSKNACLLANLEQEVQAWFAQEAAKMGKWDGNYKTLSPPDVYDPYELIRVEEAPPISQVWRRLVTFDGRPENLKPSMMLDIIHGIHGWCEALMACAKAGYAPSPEIMKQDVLTSLRRRTIEQYRDVVVQEGCPAVRDIELLMCNVAQKSVNSERDTSSQATA
jgi:CXXX repeat peptide maturase